MKLSKRLLSLFLAVVLTICLIPVTFAADSADVYYLSASGSDTNDGKSANAPFATLKKAMEALGTKEGTIKIIGAYSPSSRNDNVTHTQNITIEGYDSTSTIDSSLSLLTFGGPVTLKNITYIRGTNSYMLSWGYDITFGEGFKTNHRDDWLVFGKGQGQSSVNDINVTVKDGTFTGKFNVGAIMPSSNGFTVANDANVNVSGGSISNIILGSTNWGACGAVNFTKGVVIQHDGGTIKKLSATATGNGSPTKITGALIVINNNGSTAPTYDASLDSISVGAKYYIDAPIGAYITPVVDENGNAIQGKFNVTIANDEEKAVLFSNIKGSIELSNSGVVTLHDGVTTVSVVEDVEKTNFCYVSATGSDEYNGKTPETAVATIEKAITTVDNTRDFEIIVVGEYTLPSFTIGGHTGMMTISGYDANAVLATKPSGGYTFAGDVTIKNIKFTNGLYAWASACGNKLIFGEGVTTAGNHQICLGHNYSKTGNGKADGEVYSGTWDKYNIGPMASANKIEEYTYDAKAYISSGSIRILSIGGDGWMSSHLGARFKKNVLVKVDGGTVKSIKAGVNNYAPVFEGAVEFIFNNGTGASFDTTFNDTTAAGGKYIVYSGNGGSVDFVYDENGNSVAGKFHITIDKAGESAIITNGDNKITISESGEVTLQEGTTTVVYGNYPPNPGTTIPMEWKKMDKGYITLIFDDVRADFQKIFEIVNKEYNLPMCAAVPSNNINNNPKALHELQNRGGEILSHTKSHLVIKPFETTWDAVETQLGDSYRELTAAGFNVNGIILAGGTGQIAESDIEYRGLIELVTNKYYKYSDKYGLSTQYWKQRNWFSGRTLDQLKGIVDTHAQNKTWEVIYGHDLTEVSEENLRAFCEYLVNLQNEGKIKVVTYKYMHENFGDWASPVDFGDTTYTVDFYGTDGKTLVGSSVTVEGEAAIVPEDIFVEEGYTLKGWSGDFSKVTDNIKVSAVCVDKNGKQVGLADENVVFPPKAPTIIYVDSANGNDANKGTTPETAIATIAQALLLVETDKDFEIKIIGEFYLPATVGGHTAMMTISGYDENALLATQASGGYNLAGDLTIKNINYKNGSTAWVSANGYKIVLGEGIKTSGDHQISLGASFSRACNGKAQGEIYSGTWNKFNIGPIAASKINEYTYDAKVNVYGGTVNNLTMGGDGWSTSHKGATFKKNVLVNVDGGTVKTVMVRTNNYAPTFEGAIEIIFNKGASATIDQTFTNATPAGGKYLVYSAEGGRVDFVYDENGNSVTGKFLIDIDEGTYATIKSGDAEYNLYKSGEVTLPVGESYITYGKIAELDTVIKVAGDKEYVYAPEAVVDITHAGKITLPENMQKSGALFAGWYSDAAFTKPVVNETDIAAGKIYAKWIELSEKDMYVEGAQVRITGKRGLRYINTITHALRSQLVSLNEQNAYLDPENALFNTSTDIGYGAIVLPEDMLGEDELVKGGKYIYNEKEYAAATVPAKKTFEKASGFDRYTLVLIDIAKNNFARNYITRPYITYVDASGMKRTVYGDTYSTSLYTMAKHIYENGAMDEPEEKREEILNYMYTNILAKNDGIENPLANTYRALANDKKLTVGYIGGSITYGSSAIKTVNADGTVSPSGGNIASSYVNRTTAWLMEQFPDAKVEAVNAGISDTATNFGVYRLEDHLMNENGHDMPDLVFVEFTSNDWTYSSDGISQDKNDISRQIESLVRNIYSKNPCADIVFVFTARSLTNASRVMYVEIAEKYGIPYIDMGVPMQTLMTARGHSQESEGNYFYTVDNLHPSAEGYRIYFEEIKKTLTEALIETPVYYAQKKNHEELMPEQLNRSLWLEPSVIPASQFTVSGADIAASGAITASMFGMGTTAVQAQITPDSILVTGEDAKASFKFTGTSFGLIFGMNSSGVNVDYTIDGHDVKNITIDEELLSFQKYSHAQIFILEQELAYGEHTIEMTFNPTSDGKVNVKIGGAAVSGVDNGFQKLIALTIDDGPKNDASNAILDVLKKYGAHATFYVVGSSCNESTKAVLNRMLAEGSEIGNHSNGWSAISELTTEEVLKDYNTAQEKIYSLTGFYPKVYRAPGNRMSDAAYAAIPVPVLNGYGIGTDWEADYPHESRLANLRNAMSADGRVVLIHDKLENVKALDIVLQEVTEQGFKIVTASELIKLRGYNPEKYKPVMYKDFAK